MPPISEAFVGLGAKNLYTPGDGKGDGPMLGALNRALLSEIVGAYQRDADVNFA